MKRYHSKLPPKIEINFEAPTAHSVLVLIEISWELQYYLPIIPAEEDVINGRVLKTFGKRIIKVQNLPKLLPHTTLII
jgi:hypothetical protein